MSYKIHPMSERAKRMFVPDIKNDKPLPLRLDRRFPFAQLKVGESFYVVFRENPNYLRILAQEWAARYNRTYNCYFAKIKYKDRLEIARIA